MSYELGKSVSVRVHSRGVPENGEVGVNEDRTIFGYVAYGRITHMSYRLDEFFVPSEVIANTRGGDGKFYFDWGNKFTIDADVLEDAFRRLDLL